MSGMLDINHDNKSANTSWCKIGFGIHLSVIWRITKL